MSKSKKDFLKYYVIKKHIAEDIKLRSSKDALELLNQRYNEDIKNTISDAAEIAEADRRKTILKRDMESSLDKNMGRADLSWREVLDEFLRQNPTEVGKISEGIGKYIRKKHQQGKEK
ncbi:MAG: NFYB/HAP3 family transcription factor subunit [Elusimicrobia bacterium]|jgi:histone H3/H4|nr:NFYB/HAP3 family transcription factor subunit [Elusimicrobiota bacterium]